MRKLLALGLLPAIMVFIGNGIAHADDQTYLNDLNQNHIGTGVINDPVGFGHFVCTQLHGGMSPAQADHLTWGPGLDMPGVVATAQHDLCPDTLR